MILRGKFLVALTVVKHKGDYMKKFAKMFSAAALIGFIGTASMSVLADANGRHDRPHHHGAKEFRIDKKEARLQLTEEQRFQLAALRDDASDNALRLEERKARSAFNSAVQAGANDAELQVLAEALGKLHAQKMVAGVKAKRDFESVLTPEQKQQLQERRAKRHQQWKGRAEGNVIR